MPALLGNPPGILTPGRGPNGPGPIDARKPETSVGFKSSVPYGPTLGYAASNSGVTGFVGPAAGSLRPPTTWYARVGGSNTNGGTTTALSSARTGTDGAGSSANATFTAASGAFTSADVGQGICVQNWNGANRYYKIVAFISSTQVTLDRNGQSVASSLTWTLGGAWADAQTILTLPASQLGATTTIQSGDTIYIGAGTYRVVAALGTGFTPAFNGQVSIVGDVDGSHTGDVGMVQWTGYTTNDKTAPSASSLLTMNGRSNIAFSNIMFQGGNAATVAATVVTSQNISFIDCAFNAGMQGGFQAITVTNAYPVQFGWLIDRCHFNGSGRTTGTIPSILITLTASTPGPADYAANFVVRNTMFLSDGISVAGSAALTRLGGGVIARNCFFHYCLGFFTGAASATSVTFPCQILNSFIFAGGQFFGVQAGTTGQLTEDYNVIVAASPRSNVNAGAHSISDGSYAPLYHFGQERIWGALLRPFSEPMAGSPLLGLGNDGSQTTYDLYNRPRPAGGGALPYPAVGALERGNIATKETSVTHTGTAALKFTGPGYQDFLVPVDASATTLSMWLRYDSPYAGTLPQIAVLANGEIGVTAQSASSTGAGAGAYEKVTLAPFTPTGKGFVTFRVTSFDAAGSGIAYADTFLSA